MRLIFFTCCLLTYLTTVGQEADSLSLELQNRRGAERIPVLHELTINVWLNYPSEAMKYGEEALTLSQAANDSTNISKSLRLIAGVHYYKGDFETSLTYNLRALDMALPLNDQNLINNCYNNIGLIYYNIGSYPLALEYLMRALQIKNQTKEVYGKATTLNNIGLTYEKNELFDEARAYFFQALKLAKNTKDKNLQVYSLNNIGLTYLKEQEYKIASNYFEDGRTMAHSINNINWGAASLRGLGQIELENGDISRAQELINRAMKESLSIEDKSGIAEGFILQARLAFTQGRLSSGINWLDSAQYYARKIKSSYLMEIILNEYIKAYEGNQQEFKVVQFQDELLQLKDSLALDATKRNLELIPIKLKEESDRLTLNDQSAELRQRTYLSRIYLIILLFSIPLIALLILLLTKIRTSNLKLRDNNEKIAAQKEEIETQNQQLTQSIRQLNRAQNLLTESEKMATIGQLVGGLAHELNNPLNYIGGVISPLRRNLRELEEFSQQISDSDAHHEMNLLLDGIADGTKKAAAIIERLKALSPKLRTEDKEPFDLSDCIEETIESAENELNQSDLVQNLINEPIRVTSNYYEITKILHAILTNAIQSVSNRLPIQRKVYVEAIRKETEVTIVIQDNGIGIEPENLEQIFLPFYTTKESEGASGLGLFVAQSLIERNGGDIRAESEYDEGTTFFVTLPLN